MMFGEIGRFRPVSVKQPTPLLNVFKKTLL